MKKKYLIGLLAIMVIFNPSMTFKTNAQRVDTPANNDGMKVCKTEKWSVGDGYTAETWFSGGIKGVPVDEINPKAKGKYNHTFSNITDAGGYTGLYGWCGRPGATDAIEFYINEDWVGNSSINMSSCVKMGTITVDGGTYDIYTRPVKGKAFAQWWSNRTSPRTKGTISYAKHFQEWRKLGMPDVVLTRLTYAFECTWGAVTGGSLKYSSYKIDKP
jgi:hypothetical protein